MLDGGEIECDLGWLVQMPNPGTLANKNPSAIWTRIPVLMFYIEHPQAKILCDTSFHPEWRKTRSKQSQKFFPYVRERLLETALREINVSPNEIDYVIATHLHGDHAGGMYLFSDKKAKIVAQREEVREAFYQSSLGIAYNRSDFDIKGLKWTLINGDYDLVDGVKLLSLPGHTAGTMGVMITLDSEGTFILTSDAVDTKENYGPPARLPGSLSTVPPDSLGWVRSVEKIRRLAQKYDAKLVFSHDPEQWKTLKRAPSYYC